MNCKYVSGWVAVYHAGRLYKYLWDAQLEAVFAATALGVCALRVVLVRPHSMHEARTAEASESDE